MKKLDRFSIIILWMVGLYIVVNLMRALTVWGGAL